MVITFERETKFFCRRFECAEVIPKGGHRVVSVNVPLDFSTQLQVMLRPVGAAVGCPFFPLFFGRYVGDAATCAKVELVVSASTTLFMGLSFYAASDLFQGFH